MSESIAEKFCAIPIDERLKIIESMSKEEAASILRDWRFWARKQQLLPEGDWATWLILAGRGWGKTATGAQYIRSFGVKNPGSRIAIVAPTYGDARDICIEGESGLRNAFHPRDIAVWNRSLGEMILTNGTIYKIFSADEPNRLRGPQHHAAWCDELAAWRYAQETFDMLLMGLRLGKSPRNIITTTPRPIQLIRDLLKDSTTYATRGSTYDNRSNLAPAFFAQMERRYASTRLGRQEIFAEILDDVPGALWTHSLLDEHRVKAHPDLVRVVVAIDPAATSAEGSNETGIIVAGIDGERHGYVLEDLTCQLTPAKWGEVAVKAFDKYQADRIVAETNQGGEMVEHVVMTAAKELYRQNLRSTPKIAYRGVRATRGKYTRAEPISALYEQGRVHHVGMFAKLEDELCSWVPGEDSPDRLDATVWAFTDLLLQLGEQRKPQPTVSMRTF